MEQDRVHVLEVGAGRQGKDIGEREGVYMYVGSHLRVFMQRAVLQCSGTERNEYPVCYVSCL